jgi:WXG100 family type VII secretion target
MSDMLVVNFGALQQASADISRAVETMRSQLDELERQAAPLVASWDGAAKAAYAQRQAAWRQAAGDLTGMLYGIKLAVDQSVADYLHTEQRNTELFQ